MKNRYIERRDGEPMRTRDKVILGFGLFCIVFMVARLASDKIAAHTLSNIPAPAESVRDMDDWEGVDVVEATGMRASYYVDKGLPILAVLETGGERDPDQAIGDGGKAVGRYQIHPIMVREANRILGKEVFTLEDRTDRYASERIARTYLAYWLPRRFGDDVQPQHMAMLWKGGPNPEVWGAGTRLYAGKFLDMWVEGHPDG
jgi:hypothetical protein